MPKNPLEANNMDSIAIVAATEDTPGIGEWLHMRLKGAGYKVWLSEYDLPLGTPIAAGLEQAIVAYDRVLLVLNQAGIDSHWTNFQSELALSAQARIIPVVTDNAQLPQRYQMRKALAIRGSDDWQALHRLVNDLGGAEIPRVINLSGRAELQAQGVLVLADIPFPALDIADSASLTGTAIKLGRKVTPFLTWNTGMNVGVVPPGLAPLAVALFAYLASSVNHLPPIFWPHPASGGQFQISKDVFVALQSDVRMVGLQDRHAIPPAGDS